MVKPIPLSRRTWGVAGVLLVACAGGAGANALFYASPSEARPDPPRVYSSCLVADTKPMPVDSDPCDGR